MQFRAQNLSTGGPAGAMHFSAPTRVTVACMGVRLKTFDIANGHLEGEVSLPELRPPGTFSRDGHLFAASARSGIDVFDARTGERRISLPTPAPATRLAFSPEGNTLAAALEDRTVRIWDVAKGALLRTMSTGLGSAPALAYSPDGAVLVATSSDTDVRVFQTKDGELRRRIEQFLLSMFAAEYSPDGTLVAMGGVDRNIYIFDTASLGAPRQLPAHPEIVASIAFSPDGKWILTGGCDETGFRRPAHVRVSDLASGSPLWTGDAPSGVFAVEFAPDGKSFATLHTTGAASVWTLSA